MSSRPIRVLIVDDSAIARELLERGLSRDPEIEVVGKAADAWAARDKIVLLKPDVMTLDVEMPRMDGIEFLKRLLPQYPVPTVIVSAVTEEGSRRALDALEAGAVAVVAKPRANDQAGLMAMIEALREAVKEGARADIGKLRRAEASPASGSAGTARPAPGTAFGTAGNIVVAVGASTGGTVALNRIIPELPADMPPVVIVQHMPPVFTRMFAESLAKVSRMRVREASDGDRLERGLVLIAPGDRHLRVGKGPLGPVARLGEGPKVSGHRPSVDVLFASVAELMGARAAGLLLTGMGRDGADGLLDMRRRGARTLAQDERSSVVFGMPREAWECGAAERLVPLDQAAEALVAAARAACRGAAPQAAGRDRDDHKAESWQY